MRNLQEATERICELKGSVLALDALVAAMLRQMPQAARTELQGAFASHSEFARTALLHAPISEHTIASFERDVARMAALISHG